MSFLLSFSSSEHDILVAGLNNSKIYLSPSVSDNYIFNTNIEVDESPGIPLDRTELVKPNSRYFLSKYQQWKMKCIKSSLAYLVKQLNIPNLFFTQTMDVVNKKRRFLFSLIYNSLPCTVTGEVKEYFEQALSSNKVSVFDSSYISHPTWFTEACLRHYAEQHHETLEYNNSILYLISSEQQDNEVTVQVRQFIESMAEEKDLMFPLSYFSDDIVQKKDLKNWNKYPPSIRLLERVFFILPTNDVEKRLTKEEMSTLQIKKKEDWYLYDCVTDSLPTLHSILQKASGKETRTRRYA